MQATLRRESGFTLIELMVALAVMAIMAMLSWRGMSAMMEAQTQIKIQNAKTLALQAGLSQWRADLDAVQTGQVVPPAIDFDGQVLRMVRQVAMPPAPTGAEDANRTTNRPALSPTSLAVVAWVLRDSPGSTTETNAPNGESNAVSNAISDAATDDSVTPSPAVRSKQWVRWQSAPVTNTQEMARAWAQAKLWANSPDERTRPSEAVIATASDWEFCYVYGKSQPCTNPQSGSAGNMPVAVQMRLNLADPDTGVGWVQIDWLRGDQ